jgi:hypothetical protein
MQNGLQHTKPQKNAGQTKGSEEDPPDRAGHDREMLSQVRLYILLQDYIKWLLNARRLSSLEILLIILSRQCLLAVRPGPVARKGEIVVMLSNLPQVNAALGMPMRKGQVMEISGPSPCGKSALALSFCAKAQNPVWLDLDGTFSPKMALSLGVQEMTVLRPFADVENADIENFLSITVAAMKPSVVVLDPFYAIESPRRRTLIANLAPIAFEYGFCGIIVSNGRDAIFLGRRCAVRITMAPIKSIGNRKGRILFRIEKNANAPAYRQVSYDVEFSE